jgi:hypothetical protein
MASFPTCIAQNSFIDNISARTLPAVLNIIDHYTFPYLHCVASDRLFRQLLPADNNAQKLHQKPVDQQGKFSKSSTIS